MKPLKSVARRGGALTAATLVALSLAACSTGQIAQTSEQVTAVDGNFGQTEDGRIAVRNSTVIVEEDGRSYLRFVAVNQDPAKRSEHELRSVTVNGKQVNFSELPKIGHNCSLVGDSAEHIRNMPDGSEVGCIDYTRNDVDNDGFPVGGVAEVTYTFDVGSITLESAISAPDFEAGTEVRGYNVTDERTRDGGHGAEELEESSHSDHEEHGAGSTGGH